MRSHIISLQSLPPDMKKEILLNNDAITRIEPDNIRPITDGDIPNDVKFFRRTSDTNSPEDVSYVEQVTNGNFPSVIPVLIEFIGEQSKQRAQLCWICINRELARFNVPFQFVILDEDNHSRILILPEDYNSNS
jgi:hypothetical protein